MLQFIIDFFKSIFSQNKQITKKTKTSTNNETKKEKNLLHFKHDSEKLRQEFNQLGEKNSELKALISSLQLYVAQEIGKDVIITHLYRTREQQDNFYKGTKRGNRSYDSNPWKSPHQFWHAIDIRSKNFTEKEIKKIEKYLNKKYNKTNYYKWTAKCHIVRGENGKSFGAHFHIQYYKTK